MLEAGKAVDARSERPAVGSKVMDWIVLTGCEITAVCIGDGAVTIADNCCCCDEMLLLVVTCTFNTFCCIICPIP